MCRLRDGNEIPIKKSRHRIRKPGNLHSPHNSLTEFTVYSSRPCFCNGSDEFRCGAARVLEKGPKMNPRKRFTGMTTGGAVLGMALCYPAAMLAQDNGTAPAQPPQATSDQQPGQQPMRHHHAPSAQRQLRHLTKTLNLTSDQQQQMLPILQDQQKQMETIHNNTALSPQDRRQQMNAAKTDTHQKLEALMTDTQKQQFEKSTQHRRKHMHNHANGQGQGEGAPPPPSSEGTPPPAPPQ
jgi:hypothetical protein